MARCGANAGLRRHELQSAINSLPRLADAQLATVKIDIFPTQAQRLAASQTDRQRHCPQGDEGLVGRAGLGQRLYLIMSEEGAWAWPQHGEG